jgi:tRNA modification GTPase
MKCRAHVAGPRHRAEATTLVAVLTPRGRGAIASLSVSGPSATTDVQRLFSPLTGQPLANRPLNRPVLGHWHAADRREPAGESLIVCRTSQDSLEVHSHGGHAILEFILATLTAIGCRVVASDQWTPRPVMDRMTFDAFRALPRARTLPTAGILLDQLQGALSRAVRQTIADVTDGPPARAVEILRSLLAYSQLGLHLTRPFRIAVVGAVNAGKSSLVNAILGYQRSLVHHEAGTTRDVLTAYTAVSGWPVQLADTAGYRHTDDGLEGEGIARGAMAADSADLVLLVTDAAEAWTDERYRFENQSATVPLIVHSKCDLIARAPADRPAGWLVSARTGSGLGNLMQAISRRLVPEVPPPGAAVPFEDEHCRVIRSALGAIQGSAPERAVTELETLLDPVIAEDDGNRQES